MKSRRFLSAAIFLLAVTMCVCVSADTPGALALQRVEDMLAFGTQALTDLPGQDGDQTSKDRKAAGKREPRIADWSENSIYGISEGEVYTTEEWISFWADGSGMDNDDPMENDTRCLPVSWMVLESRPFTQTTDLTTFRIAKAGGFTLSVTFNEQRYNGRRWVNTDFQDVEDISFTVVQAETEEEPEEESTVSAPVDTGDDSMLLRLLLLLALAQIGIAVVVGARSRRRS